MKTNRRNFLKKAGYTLLGTSIFWGLSERFQFLRWTRDQLGLSSKKDFWLWSNIGVPRRYTSSESQNKGPSGVVGFNPSTGEKKFIPMSFYGHHLAHDKNSQLAATCEKWNTSAALLDLKVGKVIAEIKAPTNMRFFGHIQFADNSSEIYVSAVDDELHEGVVLVFNTLNLELKRSFKSHGQIPHQLLLYHPDELMVAHARSKSITVLNPHNGELLRTFNINNPSPAHFVFERSLDTLIVGGRNFPNAPDHFAEKEKKIFENRFKSILSVLEFHDGYNGSEGNLMKLPHSEILSLEKTNINGNWFSLVTLPHANKIYLCDLKKRSMICELETDFSPRGIAFSPHSPEIFFVNSEKRELFQGQIVGKENMVLKLTKISEFGNSSHISLTST